MTSIETRVKLSVWAKRHGLTSRSARQMLSSGTLPAELDPVNGKSGRHRYLQRCRTPVSWRVKLLAKGKVQLSVTCEEAEPAIVSEQAGCAVGVDVTADPLAYVTLW